MSGCYLVRKEVLENCAIDPIGYKTLIEIVVRSKTERITEVGYTFRERQAGESKVTWKHYIEYLIQLIRLRQCS